MLQLGGRFVFRHLVGRRGLHRRVLYTQLNRQDWRQANTAKRSQYRAAESFLSRLDREVTWIQNVGDAEAFRVRGGYDPSRDGDHRIRLLTYMTRNGVKFDKAAPGDEAAYQTAFQMMRDLYVTVADFDEGIQPKNLMEQVN